jgi:hypothetical protein
MTVPRTPPIPTKAQLTWRIARLRLDDSGRRWIASGFKGDRVATIVLPDRGAGDSDSEEVWLGRIEAAFEQRAFDPAAQADPPEPAWPASSEGALSRGRLRALSPNPMARKA